jgi:hypothetical protein
MVTLATPDSKKATVRGRTTFSLGESALRTFPVKTPFSSLREVESSL